MKLSLIIPELKLLFLRMRGRATCVKGPGSQVRSTARIINLSASDQNIRIGSNSVIRGEIFVFAHGGKVEIGDWCFVGEGSRLWSGASITIGNRVMIAHNVNIFDNLTHPLAPESRHQHFKQILLVGHPAGIDLEDSPVIIEDDAWIGSCAILLKGVRIGKCAVVGAGAVVTRDVPARTLVAGNPARVVKMLDAAAAAK